MELRKKANKLPSPDSTSFKMLSHNFRALCQDAELASFCSRTKHLSQGSDLSSCVMIISHNIFRSQM